MTAQATREPSIVGDMRRLSELMKTHCGIRESDRDWLNSLVREWHLLADTSFSDLILWLPDCSDENVFWAGAQIRPTTGPTALEDDVVGEEIRYEPDSMVTAAFLGGEIIETSTNNMRAKGNTLAADQLLTLQTEWAYRHAFTRRIQLVASLGCVKLRRRSLCGFQAAVAVWA